MHFIIGTLIAVASLVYWLGMASRGAREISSLAHDVKNMPRRRKFQKDASKEALDMIDDPVDAAAILMIAIARSNGVGSGGGGRVSDIEGEEICRLLENKMQLTPDHAEDLILQLKALTQQITLQDTLLFRMVDVLRGNITADDAQDLAQMLEAVAASDGPPSLDQKEMVRRFKERMGISY